MKQNEAYEAFLDKKYNELSPAQMIVFTIVHDLNDRSGLSSEWDCIDSDIQEEILQTWIESTEAFL